MPHRVEWTAASEHDLQRLPDQVRNRIRRAVAALAEDGPGDVKRLQGRDREWRLRVGDWRVLFEFVADSGEGILRVLRVQPRDRTYRD